MADPITFRPTVRIRRTSPSSRPTAPANPRHPARAGTGRDKKHQADLRADAARLAANPDYQAEIRAVREELDELRAW